MIRVRFVAADGTVTVAEGAIGSRLLDVARAVGQPLEGTCNGDLACATCHIVVDPADFSRLTPATAEEEDMLDFAPGATRNSRLSCQIVLAEALDGLTVRVPES